MRSPRRADLGPVILVAFVTLSIPAYFREELGTRGRGLLSGARRFRTAFRVPQEEIAPILWVHIALGPARLFVSGADGARTEPELASVVRTRLVHRPCSTRFRVPTQRRWEGREDGAPCERSADPVRCRLLRASGARGRCGRLVLKLLNRIVVWHIAPRIRSVSRCTDAVHLIAWLRGRGLLSRARI